MRQARGVEVAYVAQQRWREGVGVSARVRVLAALIACLSLREAVRAKCEDEHTRQKDTERGDCVLDVLMLHTCQHQSEGLPQESATSNPKHCTLTHARTQMRPYPGWGKR